MDHCDCFALDSQEKGCRGEGYVAVFEEGTLLASSLGKMVLWQKTDDGNNGKTGRNNFDCGYLTYGIRRIGTSLCLNSFYCFQDNQENYSQDCVVPGGTTEIMEEEKERQFRYFGI